MEKFFDNTVVWWLLIIAIVGDFAIAFILAPLYKTYNHKTMVMSVLGNPSSPVRVCYNIWLVVLGLLLLLSAFAVYFRYCNTSKPLAIAVAVMIALFAIGAGILAGVFSVNETKEIETIASKIHGIGSALGFMALCFVPLMLAILSFSARERLDGAVCLASFVLALFFFILFVMSDKPAFQNSIIVFEGLWQRLTLLFMYVPLAYIAIQNIMVLSRRS